jgi:hypothetical protein
MKDGSDEQNYAQEQQSTHDSSCDSRWQHRLCTRYKQHTRMTFTTVGPDLAARGAKGNGLRDAELAGRAEFHDGLLGPQE